MSTQKALDPNTVTYEDVPEEVLEKATQVLGRPPTLDDIMHLLNTDPGVMEAALKYFGVDEKDADVLSTPKKPRTAEEDLQRLRAATSQARLMERIQYDGDVPEYRVSPLRPDLGQKAAVSVTSNSFDPLVIGLQMEAASDRITRQALRLLQEGSPTLDPANTEMIPVAEEQESLTALQVAHNLYPELLTVKDPPGYERGSIPVPQEPDPIPFRTLMEVPTPRAQELLASVQNTTQGRRSAMYSIASYVSRLIPGIHIRPVFTLPLDARLEGSLLWTISITEAKHINPCFNLITTAGSVLAAKIRKQAPSENVPEFWITTYDDYAEKRVGFALVPVKEARCDSPVAQISG